MSMFRRLVPALALAAWAGLAMAQPPPSDAAALEPVVKFDPIYPATAERRGIGGFVDVEFDVTPSGAVENAHVKDSSPAGVFDAAALAAVERWRYAPDATRAPVTLTQRVEFDIDKAILGIPSPDEVGARTGQATRNACLREQAAYNFGEVIEVDLFSACGEPLIVYACGEGGGVDPNRWVCQNSENRGHALVPPNDPRIGQTLQIPMPVGTRAVELTDEFSLRRAPNTEYWWIACEIRNQTCRDAGRRWLENVDGQPANLNPGLAGDLPVGRSY